MKSKTKAAIPEIRQITVVGTGLIGASFGLALKKRGFTGRIVGCDRPLALAQARNAGAIDVGIMNCRQALAGSQVILFATPVGTVIELIEKIGPMLPDGVLLTDVGSTKREVVARARAVFGEAAPEKFLAGHPMAGKEHSGTEHADADLFQNAVWLVTPMPSQDISEGMSAAFLELVQKVGARVVTTDPGRHDKLCAWVSHLPQMISTALAASLENEFGDSPELHAIGGRALREMTRIASSPYSMWRDIAITNTANIEEALLSLEQRLSHIRENLRTRELEKEFEQAGTFASRK